MKHPTLFIVAARSGGHLLPGLELGKKWLRENPSGDIFLFTSGSKLDARIVADYPLVHVVRCWLGNLPGKKLWRYPFFLVGLWQTIMRTASYMVHNRPEKIISTGGYLSVPVCLVARFFRVPIELYELNVEPGRATRFLAPRASRINLTFAKSKKLLPSVSATCRVVSYPLRAALKKNGSRLDAIDVLNIRYESRFAPERKTLFVLGGSQGSFFFNHLMQHLVRLAPSWLSGVQIIHQTHARHLKKIRRAYAKQNIPACVFSYEADIQPLYDAADLVVSRAGAGTLFELAFLEKKALVIPLRAASTSHQVSNAAEMRDAHPQLFTMLDQQSLHPRYFVDTLGRLLG